MEGGLHYMATTYAAGIATIRETNECKVGRSWEFGRVVNPRGSEARGEEREGIEYEGT